MGIVILRNITDLQYFRLPRVCWERCSYSPCRRDEGYKSRFTNERQIEVGNVRWMTCAKRGRGADLLASPAQLDCPPPTTTHSATPRSYRNCLLWRRVPTKLTSRPLQFLQLNRRRSTFFHFDAQVFYKKTNFLLLQN